MPKKRKKASSSRIDCRKKIKSVDTTKECLSSRSGLAPYVNFLNGSAIADELERTLIHLRKSKKGIALSDTFSQLLLFFADGTEKCLEGFDKLKENKAWQKLHGCKKTLNTGQLKRVLEKVSKREIELLRPLIRQIFLSALKASSPDKVVLFLDSSVYDNDGAKCRAGVKPTYKKKKGYHPINLIWHGLYVDTVFQRGDYSTNHDGVAIKMLQEITPFIRATLGKDIQIIVRMDSGYYDQKIFSVCDELNIKFICAGKRYRDHQYLEEKSLDNFDGIFQNNTSQWHFCRFQERRTTWSEKMQYRALFLRATEENGETLLGLDSRIILTNLDEKECTDEQIIKYDHSRGADELTHRAAKEFSDEKMPCLDYHANAFWYTLSIIAFNLFQIFKRNIACFPYNAYPNTVRRKLFDLAGKIVKGSNSLILKISEWKMRELKFDKIWQRSLIPWTII
jgi:hypothetical protein